MTDASEHKPRHEVSFLKIANAEKRGIQKNFL